LFLLDFLLDATRCGAVSGRLKSSAAGAWLIADRAKLSVETDRKQIANENDLQL
jgi:hypothetical protein